MIEQKTEVKRNNGVHPKTPFVEVRKLYYIIVLKNNILLILEWTSKQDKMEVGYARVSTQEQNLDLQIDAFSKAGIMKVFTDKISGVKSEKPELNKMLAYTRAGNTIVVWRLDRLGRTTVQLIQFIEELSKQGIGIKSLTEPIDTSTATGTLVVQLFCVLAEHESKCKIIRGSEINIII